MRQELIIRISLRTTLAIAGVVLLILLLSALTNILIIFFLAILLAVSISPPVNWLEERGVPRGLGIGLIYLVMIAALIALAFVLVPVVLKQVQLLIQQFPNLVREPLRQGSEWLGTRVPALRDDLPTGELASQAANKAVALLSGVGGFALKFSVQIGSLLIGIFLVLVLAYFLTSRRGLATRTVELFAPPAYRQPVNRLFQVIGRRLGRWFWAQAMIAGFYALAFGTGLVLLKVPYAIALAVMGGLLELVPYVGGFVATILTMIVAFTTDPILALWVLILHIIIGNIEVHILAPRLMGHAVETHPVVAILALGAGAELLGIVGAVIAIPLVVVVQAVIEEFYLGPRAQAVEVASQGQAGAPAAPVQLHGQRIQRPRPRHRSSGRALWRQRVPRR